MLGVVVGSITAICLLVFMQYDPQAVKKKKQEKKKLEEEKQAELKKAKEQIQKKLNDPAQIQKREQKKVQMKDKMMKGLSEDQKKLIGDYLKEQKSTGKSEEQIIKEASTKAILFVCCLMFMLVFSAIVIFIVLGGKQQEFVQGIDKAIGVGQAFLQWNFPKLAGSENGLPGTSATEYAGASNGGGTAQL